MAADQPADLPDDQPAPPSAAESGEPPDEPPDGGEPADESGDRVGHGAHRRPHRLRTVLVLAVAVCALVAVGVAVVVAAPWSQDEEPAPAASATPGATPPAAAPDPEAPNGGERSQGVPPEAQERARGDFPNADTTGVPDGVELTTRNGPIDVRDDGAVLENLLVVDGPIEVYANNVTIRNVRITNQSQEVTWGISQREGFSGLVVEDSEIFGNPDTPHKFASAISNHGGMITVRRLEAHTITDGIVTRHGLLEDNYLHSPRYFPEDHTDMIQANGGPADGLSLEIRNNVVINTEDQTAAIFLQDFTGHENIPVQNVLIEDNYLAGGGYTIYGGGMADEGHDPANIVIRNNVFAREVYPDSGRWGPSAYFDESAPGNEWSGNVWDDGDEVELGEQA